MNAQRQYGIVVDSVDKYIEKLSSGYRINKAADDAAGLSVSEKMRKQIRGLKQGVDNTEDGVSLCQVADGALAEVADMVHRISELAIKSANGTNSDNDRQYIQDEVSQLLKEIDRISDTTKFNEIKLFSVENTELSYKVEQASSEKNTQITLSQDEIVNKLLSGNYNMISKSFVTLRGVELSAQTYNAIMASLSTCMIGIDLYEKIDNGLIDYDGTSWQNTVKLQEYAVQIFKNAKYDDTKWSNYQGEIDNAISLLEGYSTALTNNLAESVSDQATQMLLNITTANDYVGKTMHGVAGVLGWKARLNHTVQGADTNIIYYSNRTLNQFATSIGDSLLTEKLNNNVQQVLRDDWSMAPHLYRCEGDVEVSEICEVQLSIKC